jgi:archaellin
MLLKNSRGLEGLDALIILVALVLTVAVASIILITTINTIQQRTLAQAAESRKNIMAGTEVINVIGSDASPTDEGGTPHKIEELHMLIRAFTGSNFPFNSTLIMIEHSGEEQVIVFNATCQQDCNAISTSKYMLYYREGPTFRQDYLSEGDTVKVAIKLTNPLIEGEEVRITIIPRYGPRTQIKFETPLVMMKQLQGLYPTA